MTEIINELGMWASGFYIIKSICDVVVYSCKSSIDEEDK